MVGFIHIQDEMYRCARWSPVFDIGAGSGASSETNTQCLRRSTCQVTQSRRSSKVM